MPENTSYSEFVTSIVYISSEFDPEEMEKALRAFDKKFLRSNIQEVLNGWGLMEFTEEGFTLRLNGRGIKHCQEHDKGT